MKETLEILFQKYREGEKLGLNCWCAGARCHGENYTGLIRWLERTVPKENIVEQMLQQSIRITDGKVKAVRPEEMSRGKELFR
ncbi:MAG: hypothetical protein HC921_17500 [Synechococcaceae cyanobacterium SM2_3_1]|nr:hypothetical protein [Synechococcaceae cyanobacterium SM2_3_1]